MCEQAQGRPTHHQSVLWRAPEVFFIKVLSTSEVQQISDPLGCNGFSAPCFTSNLKCLRAFLSLVFTRDCFLESPGLSVTLKTNKTTSAVLIFFDGSGETGPNILSLQTAVSEVIDRPACRRYYLPMEQNVSPPIYLFAFLSVLFAPCLCERGHFMEVSGERKYFYLAINGSMEMCLPV